MECGSQDLFCQFTNWLAQNEIVLRHVTELAGKLGENAVGAWGVIAKFLQDYGQTLVGALGLTFGFYRWWRYREHILHKRLSEYIGSRDVRLKGAREEVLEAIQRPAPGQAFKAPLFIDGELRSVLREREWGNSVLALTVASSADWQLSSAIRSIKRKLQTAEKEVACLKQELCTAFSVRGAVAATRKGSERDLTALGYFRSALDLSGSNDVRIKELEAHQLRKLGYYTEAAAAYECVMELAGSVQPARDANIVRARAKRYMAEMESSRAPGNAFQMLACDFEGNMFSPGAIAILDTCQPLNEWELVEKGDMHYLAAYLASSLNFIVAAPSHLVSAESAYQSALQALRVKRWWRGRATSRLRGHIIRGRKRVADARSNGVYDTDWLPRLQQPQ